MKYLDLDGDLLPVVENDEHEWVMTTELVAKGYGVTSNVLHQHKRKNSYDLTEGKHWFSRMSKRHSAKGAHKEILWTKRGVVRLGFFIRSERARKFRDIAEDLIIRAFDQELRNYSVELFLQELPQEWRKQFPDTFFRAITDCYGIRYVKGRTPGFVGSFINRYIYEPLLRNLSDELKTKREEYCDQFECSADAVKLHQFLNENCRETLSRHISNIETLLAVSRSEIEFKEHFAARFEGKQQLHLEFQTKKERIRALRRSKV